MSEGATVIKISWAATGVFAVFATVGVFSPAVRPIALAVDVVLFLGGCAAFLWALALAAGRSRQVEMGIGGLFFLAGSAPKAVRLHLLGSFAVQVAVAFLTASVRLFTPLAGGMLVPVLGLAMAGQWASRFGAFPDRKLPERP